MHRDGTLLARYPPATAALGKHFPPLDESLASRAAAARPMRRSVRSTASSALPR